MPTEAWGTPVRVVLGKNETGEVVALKAAPAPDILCDFQRVPPGMRNRLDQMFGHEDDEKDEWGLPLGEGPIPKEEATDWDCPACGANNFASRDNCYKCGKPR